MYSIIRLRLVIAVRNSYYFDGMDVPFNSLIEISDFLLSLPGTKIYQFIDRYIYYGNCVGNAFICCAVLKIWHASDYERLSFGFDIVRCHDDSSYRSVALPAFMMRIFLTE